MGLNNHLFLINVFKPVLVFRYTNTSRQIIFPYGKKIAFPFDSFSCTGYRVDDMMAQDLIGFCFLWWWWEGGGGGGSYL